MKKGQVLCTLLVIGLLSLFCLEFARGGEELTIQEMSTLTGGACESCAWDTAFCEEAPGASCMAMLHEICYADPEMPPYVCGTAESTTGPWRLCGGTGEGKCVPGGTRYCEIFHECETQWLLDTCPWDANVYGYWVCLEVEIRIGATTGYVGSCVTE